MKVISFVTVLLYPDSYVEFVQVLPVAVTVTTNPFLTDVDVLFATVTLLFDNEYPLFAVLTVYDIVGVYVSVAPDEYVADCVALAVIVLVSPETAIEYGVAGELTVSFGSPQVK